MERPIRKPLGTPARELDTPALVVDLAALEHNLETLHSFFRKASAKVRPYVPAHRCPAIAHKQLAAGGTVGGVCVGVVGGAEAFAASGIADILVASEVVTAQKIGRLCALAHHARMTVAVDSVQNVRDLSGAAQQSHVTLGVVVHVRVRGVGAGVAPGAAAVELARQVAESKGLSFQGLMAHEGVSIAESPDKLVTDSRAALQPVLDTRQMVERAGLDVPVVSVGGTHNYEIAGAMSGVTEVRAGSYALMDHRYAKHRPQLKVAARVLATVTSRPDAESVITDTGQKAIGADLGLPVPDGVQGLEVVSLSAEHGKLKPLSDAASRLDVGDKLWLVPYDIGTCVNLYDYMHAVRDGKLEAVWEVAARGLYQ